MLASCIMPTQNRRSFIPRAIHSYLLQDWPEKELIVVDSGTDRVEDLFRGVPGARYKFYSEPRPSYLPNVPIGTKRNIACEMASGEVIVHFDDDDFSAPGRISAQIELMQSTGKDVVGFNRVRTVDLDSLAAGELSVQFACGTSLCYRRSYWAENRFPLTSFGEDWTFAERAFEQGQLATIDGVEFITATTHTGNTCKRS